MRQSILPAAVVAFLAPASDAAAATLPILIQRADLDAGPGAQVLQFAPFDPSDGTLVQVIASLTGAITFPGAEVPSPPQDFRDPDFRARATFELTVDFLEPGVTLHDSTRVAAGCDKFELAGSGTYLPCTASLPPWRDGVVDFVTLDASSEDVSGFVADGVALPLLAIAALGTDYSDAEDGAAVAPLAGTAGRVTGTVTLRYLYQPPPDLPPPDLSPPDLSPPAVSLPAAAPLLALSTLALRTLARHRRG